MATIKVSLVYNNPIPLTDGTQDTLIQSDRGILFCLAESLTKPTDLKARVLVNEISGTSGKKLWAWPNGDVPTTVNIL